MILITRSFLFIFKNLFFKIRHARINRIFTHLTDQEKIVLFELARKIKHQDAIVVEIGSFLGSSSCFLAEGLKSGKIFCIDTWENDAMTEGNRDTYHEFMDNTEPYRNKIIEIKGWSYNVVEKIRDLNRKVNILFIDGDHSYAGVKMDWDLYSPFLSRGSIIIMHDSGWAEGVKRVIFEDVTPHVSSFDSLPNMWWGTIKA